MNVQHTEGQNETTMTDKGRSQRSKFSKGNGDKALTEENGQLYIYNYSLYTQNGNYTQ